MVPVCKRPQDQIQHMELNGSNQIKNKRGNSVENEDLGMPIFVPFVAQITDHSHTGGGPPISTLKPCNLQWMNRLAQHKHTRS